MGRRRITRCGKKVRRTVSIIVKLQEMKDTIVGRKQEREDERKDTFDIINGKAFTLNTEFNRSEEEEG